MTYQVKHKIPTLIVRILFGLFLVASGGMMVVMALTGGLDNLSEGGGNMPANVSAFLQAVIALGYLWPWIGLFKFVTGILVLIPSTSQIGVIAAFPYTVNILLWSMLPSMAFAFLGVPVFLMSCYLIYAYFDYYRPLVAP